MTSSPQNNKRAFDSVTTKGDTFYGLRNQGSTCYLNSVLQVLFMNKEFREAVKRHTEENNDNTQIDRQLSELFAKLSQGTAETVGITNKLGIHSVNKQSDAAEYFEKILMRTSTEASRIFQGKLEHMTVCLHCDAKTSENGPFWHLPLTLPLTDSCSVSRGIEEFFKKSELRGENQLYCDRCHGKWDSTVECKVKHHPDILTLLLKRFQFNYNYMSYTKNECDVGVPQILRMPQGPTYDLYAFVEHFGSLKSGHYTATVKSQDDRGWYNFNDSTVVQLNDNNFNLNNRRSYLTECHSPYLLFYRMRKHEPNTREVSTNSSTSEKNNQRRHALKTDGGENTTGEDNTAVVVPINRNEDSPLKKKPLIRETDKVAPRSDESSSKQDARKLDSQRKANTTVKTGRRAAASEDVRILITNSSLSTRNDRENQSDDPNSKSKVGKKQHWLKKQKQQKKDRRVSKRREALNTPSGLVILKCLLLFLCFTATVVTYVHISTLESGHYTATTKTQDDRGGRWSNFNDPSVVRPHHNHSHFDNGFLKDDPNTREVSTNSSTSEKKNNQRHDAVKTDGGENTTGEDNTAVVVPINRNEDSPVKKRVSRSFPEVQDDRGSAQQSRPSHRATEGRDENRIGNVPSLHYGQEETARRKNTSDKEHEMGGAETLDKQAKKRKRSTAETSFQKSAKDHKTVEVGVIRESGSDRVVEHHGRGESIAKPNQKRETENVGGGKEVKKRKGKNKTDKVAPRSDESSSKQDASKLDSQPKANTTVKTSGCVAASEDVRISTTISSLTTSNDRENQSDDPNSKSEVGKKSNWFEKLIKGVKREKKDKNEKKQVKMEKAPVKETRKQKNKRSNLSCFSKSEVED